MIDKNLFLKRFLLFGHQQLSFRIVLAICILDIAGFCLPSKIKRIIKPGIIGDDLLKTIMGS